MELVPDGQLSAQKKLLPNPGLGIILLFFCWFEGRKHLASMHRIPAGLDMFGVQTYMDVRNYTHVLEFAVLFAYLSHGVLWVSGDTELGKYFRRNIFTSQLDTRSQETQKIFLQKYFLRLLRLVVASRGPVDFGLSFAIFVKLTGDGRLS